MTLSPIPYSDRHPSNVPAVTADEASLRALICHIGRLMHERHFIDGISGNISARLDAQHMLATPSGLAKGFLQPDQLLLLDLEGNRALPLELMMHLECYRQRPDILGVVEAHPPTAIALTVAGMSLRACVVPEAVVTLGLVPTAAYSTPSSTENLEAVRLLIAQHDAIMLSYYGSLTIGADVWQAYLKLETLEHTATILHRAAQLGPIVPLPPEHVAKLLELRRQLGYWREGDEERFCELCGVC